MLGGLEHEWIIFPNSWDDDPIWRTHIFQRGGEKPPTSLRMDEDAISLAIHNLDFFVNNQRRIISVDWSMRIRRSTTLCEPSRIKLVKV